MADRGQTALFAALAVAVVVTAAVAPVVADERSVATWPDGPERIFYADDPESASLVDANDSDLAQLAASLDVYYRTTDPTMGAGQPSYTEYRTAQLNSIERDRDSSKYVPQSSLADGPAGVIKDAHVTYLGTARGAAPQGSIDGNGQEFVLPEGRVLNFLDYRVDESELPSPETERIDSNVTITRTDYEIDLDETGVEERIVTVDGRVVGRESGDPDARVVDYSGATGDGPVQLTIETRIVAVMDYTVVRKFDGEVTDREERSREVDGLTVRDEVTVRVVDDQSLSVSQRFVEVEGRDESLLALRFGGPGTLPDRQLWSRFSLDSGTDVVNNWGVYSTTRYTHGHVATEEGTSDFAFPHVLETKFTSSYDRPDVEVNRSKTDHDGSPEIERVRQTNVSDDRPTLDDGVNVTTTPPTAVSLLVVSDVPGPVVDAVDVFGRDVSVDTRPDLTVRESALEFVSVDDERVQVRLYDPDTGDGLSGREVAISGGASDALTTDSDGTVTISRTSSYLRVEFEGDGWREDVESGSVDGPYYAGSSVGDSFVTGEDLADSLIKLIGAGVLSLPFLLGWQIVRYIDWQP